MASRQPCPSIGVWSSQVSHKFDWDASQLQFEVMKKNAPKVGEIAVKGLELLKELDEVEAEMKSVSPIATFTYGMMPVQQSIFKSLKGRAEAHLD